MRYFTADWRGVVSTDRALELGDPFPALTAFYARAHASAVLGLDIDQVRVREVEKNAEPRDIDEVVEGDDEQASGVRLRLVKDGEQPCAVCGQVGADGFGDGYCGHTSGSEAEGGG